MRGYLSPIFNFFQEGLSNGGGYLKGVYLPDSTVPIEPKLVPDFSAEIFLFRVFRGRTALSTG